MTTPRKTTATKTTTTKRTPRAKKETVEKVEEVLVENTVAKQPTQEELMKQIAELQKALLEKDAQPVTKEKPTKRKRQHLPDIDRNELIPIFSRVDGTLLYKSKKTQQETSWEEYGSLQYLTFDEVLNMKASQPRFINDAWVIIDDEEVVEFLGLTEKYKEYFHIDDLDVYLLDTSLDELAKELPSLPAGLKTSIGIAAKKLVEAEKLDSRGKILMLEKTLKICLINF